MRWLSLALLLLAVVGAILFACAEDFAMAQEPLLGRVGGGVTAGLACIVVVFVLAVGVGLLAAR